VEEDNIASFANGVGTGECEHFLTSLSHLPSALLLFCFFLFENTMFQFNPFLFLSFPRWWAS